MSPYWKIDPVPVSIDNLPPHPTLEGDDNYPPSDAGPNEDESLPMGFDSNFAVQNETCPQNMDSSLVSNKTKDELEEEFIEPTLDASSEYASCHGEEVTRNVDNSVYNEDKGIEEMKDAGCKEEKAIEESEGGEESWWLKNLGLICQKVSEDKMLCVFVVTATLVSVAILSRRRQRKNLQFRLWNFTVAGPLNRMKD